MRLTSRGCGGLGLGAAAFGFDEGQGFGLAFAFAGIMVFGTSELDAEVLELVSELASELVDAELLVSELPDSLEVSRVAVGLRSGNEAGE